MSFSIAMHVANTGIEALSTQMRIAATNLAATGVPGYKSQFASFSDLGYESTGKTEQAKGLMLGFGTKIDSINRSFSQGTGQNTNNPYHLMIQGEGFFEILDKNGNTCYTRAGNFTLDNQKRLIMPGTGYTLNPPITLPQNSTGIQIESDGKVYAQLPNGQQSQLGSITLSRFVNNNGLMEIGNNLFVPTESSGTAQPGTPGVDSFGTLDQGWLEASNVNPMEQLIQTIEINNTYNNLLELIKKSDRMMQSGTASIS